MTAGCGLCKYGGKKRITHKRKHKGSRSNKSKLNKVSHVGGKQRKTHSKKYKLRSTKKKIFRRRRSNTCSGKNLGM